jgi:large subunit ribosomal protein L3
MLHAVTTDDREKTPNFGKPLYNSATLVAVPEVSVVGVRFYTREYGADRALGEFYSKDFWGKKEGQDPAKAAESWKDRLSKVFRLTALISIVPKDAGLSQKKPILLEVGVGGGEAAAQFDFVTKMLGKKIKFSEIFKAGSYVDVIAITKGKGFEGPVTRFGVKRKQHKSRKSVRAVGVIGPWHPAAVMYTVARAGQMGFHQRTESGKRILLIGNGKENKIDPPGGFLHFGQVETDYALLRGSIPGSTKRLVLMRHPVRKQFKKVTPPQILELSTKIVGS